MLSHRSPCNDDSQPWEKQSLGTLDRTELCIEKATRTHLKIKKILRLVTTIIAAAVLVGALLSIAISIFAHKA